VNKVKLSLNDYVYHHFSRTNIIQESEAKFFSRNNVFTWLYLVFRLTLAVLRSSDTFYLSNKTKHLHYNVLLQKFCSLPAKGTNWKENRLRQMMYLSVDNYFPEMANIKAVSRSEMTVCGVFTCAVIKLGNPTVACMLQDVPCLPCLPGAVYTCHTDVSPVVIE